jgi:hypothetical protein
VLAIVVEVWFVGNDQVRLLNKGLRGSGGRAEPVKGRSRPVSGVRLKDYLWCEGATSNVSGRSPAKTSRLANKQHGKKRKIIDMTRKESESKCFPRRQATEKVSSPA